jgi:dTDP-L-rhamnose 4-epimerase
VTSDHLGAVLVTGGAGFIGCALSQRLAATADRWVVMDNMHPQVHPTAERPPLLHAAAELVVADVTSPEDWDRVLASVRPALVVHLAAETGTAQSLDEATRHASVNVVGTTELTDALGRSGHLPEHLFLSSSRAVYGEGTWRRPDGSDFRPGQRSHAQLEAGQWDFPDATALASRADRTVPAPTSVYGATKLAQENILTAWGGSRGVPVSIQRFQNVYGPGQSLINSYTGIVSLFSQWARDGKQIPVYEDGNITRDFVYIDDVADAVAAAIHAGPSASGPIFDIGAGVGTTILELAGIIARYHGAPEPTVTGAYRDGDVRFAACEIEPTLAELDWKPEWSVDRGIAALQVWIAEQLEEAR